MGCAGSKTPELYHQSDSELISTVLPTGTSTVSNTDDKPQSDIIGTTVRQKYNIRTVKVEVSNRTNDEQVYVVGNAVTIDTNGDISIGASNNTIQDRYHTLTRIVSLESSDFNNYSAISKPNQVTNISKIGSTRDYTGKLRMMFVPSGQLEKDGADNKSNTEIILSEVEDRDENMNTGDLDDEDIEVSEWDSNPKKIENGDDGIIILLPESDRVEV